MDFSPVLILGTGLAGLITAFRLAEKGIPSTLVTKDEEVLPGSNSVLAQGGIIYRPPHDHPNALIQDILVAGDHINFLPAVEELATFGVDLVKTIFLDQLKIHFDEKEGYLDFSQEGAHSLARIIHVKDHTGKAIMESLWKAIRNHPKITVLTGHVLIDLLTSGHNCRGYKMKYLQNRCLGAFLFDLKTEQVKKILAKYTVLATGGIGQVYEYHTNSEHAYGSGLAAANRARVRIINARFVQFHPTALWTPKKGRRFLISESLRGEGARLMNQQGKYFMESFPKKDLESRAVVSKAIIHELERTKTEYVLLNLADHYKGSSPIKNRFPEIFEMCRKEGINIEKEPIPVIPAAHFFCGGVFVNLHGQTEMPGLFAVGEVACTGVHGANRLASTSLLECLTWGVKTADCIAELEMPPDEFLKKAFSLVEDWQSFGTKKSSPEEIEVEKNRIRSLMWNNVGILRDKDRLLSAKDELQLIWKNIEKKYAESALSEDFIELRHMAETAWIITNSAASHTNLLKDNLGGHILG